MRTSGFTALRNPRPLRRVAGGQVWPGRKDPEVAANWRWTVPVIVEPPDRQGVHRFRRTQETALSGASEQVTNDCLVGRAGIAWQLCIVISSADDEQHPVLP
jgi:hypothetical protein